MTFIDLIGWLAAALTLLAFTSRDVRLLRCASLGSSVAFITYGAASSTWPVLALHTVLLPVNLLRLIELHRASRSATELSPLRIAHAACGCGKSTVTMLRTLH